MSNFVLPGSLTILDVRAFSHNCVSCILQASSSKLKTFSRILFPVACVGGDTKSSTFSVSTLSKYCCPQGSWLVPSLLLSSGIGNTTSPLLGEYWADLQNELFGTRLYGTSTSLLLQDSKTQSTDACRIQFSFFEPTKNVHTTSHLTLYSGMSNVIAIISSRSSPLLRHSKYHSHHSFSTQCHWSGSGPWTLRAGCSFSPSLFGSLEE